MNKETLIEKIKKLLALATDSSTTEHEKSLAMKRAQDLMAEYSIEECDLQFINPKDLIITEAIKINFEDHIPTVLQDHVFLNCIITPICQNFGCYLYYTGIGQLGSHYIMGFKTNIEIAKYACDVLINQGVKDYKIGFKIHRSMGYSISFWKGFQEGLRARFVKVSNEKAIVLYDKVHERWSELVTFVKMAPPSSSLATGKQDGFRSATDAKLNRAVSTYKGGFLK